MTILSELPSEHQQRNVPLLSIGAQTRWLESPPGKGWHSVQPSWKIAKCCFNDLGPAWTEHWQWRATAEPATT